MAWSMDEFFRLLMTALQDYAVILTDAQGVVRHWNSGAERIFGYSHAEIVGLSAAKLFTSEDREANVPEREMAIALREGRAGDTRWHLRKDERRFWANGIMVPFFSETGEHQGFGKVLRDETAAREFVQDLELRTEEFARADAQKNVFLATLAHELRNPLAGIRMMATLLREDRPASERRQYCELIDRQVQDLNRMIDDVLDVTRIATGKIEIRKERMDVGLAMRRAAESVRETVSERRHKLTLSPVTGVWVDADPLRLQQVLVNLLVNAAKYTESGGSIWFEAVPEGDDVVIRVRDTGHGISQEMLPRIFDLFTQIDYSFQRSQGGMGIGLALARNIVQLHGGTIEARSAGLQQGSEFAVRLKRCP